MDKRLYSVKVKADNAIALADYIKGGYIMVVDDDKGTRNTLRNMFRMLGIMDLIMAEDGDYAFKKLLANDDCRFALIDWHMPRMPGIQLVREIRANDRLKDLNILIITGENNENLVAQAAEFGVNGFLLKPFVVKTLESKMIRVIEMKAHPPKYIQLIKAGERFVEEKMYSEAIDAFNESREMRESARVLEHLGEAHEGLGEFREAEQYYAKAVKMNPMYLRSYVAAANLYIKENNEAAALASLEKASEISPMNAERKTKTGELYLKQSDDEKAQKAFNDAVIADFAKSNEIGELFLKYGRNEMAEKFFRHTLKKVSGEISEEDRKRYVHTYNRLGIALRNQGKWEQAVTEYRQALLLDPDNEVLYFNMGRGYEEGHQTREALDAFKKALELDPDFEEASEELKKLRDR